MCRHTYHISHVVVHFVLPEMPGGNLTGVRAREQGKQQWGRRPSPPKSQTHSTFRSVFYFVITSVEQATFMHYEYCDETTRVRVHHLCRFNIKHLIFPIPSIHSPLLNTSAFISFSFCFRDFFTTILMPAPNKILKLNFSFPISGTTNKHKAPNHSAFSLLLHWRRRTIFAIWIASVAHRQEKFASSSDSEILNAVHHIN